MNIISPYIKDLNRAGSKNWGKCAITVFINQPKNGKERRKRNLSTIKILKVKDATLIKAIYMMCL